MLWCHPMLLFQGILEIIMYLLHQCHCVVLLQYHRDSRLYCCLVSATHEYHRLKRTYHFGLPWKSTRADRTVLCLPTAMWLAMIVSGTVCAEEGPGKVVIFSWGDQLYCKKIFVGIQGHENIYTRKFKTRKFYNTKISRSTVFSWVGTNYSATRKKNQKRDARDSCQK